MKYERQTRSSYMREYQGFMIAGVIMAVVVVVVYMWEPNHVFYDFL